MARRRLAVLEHHPGHWIAVDAAWRSVLASSPDRARCIEAARGAGTAGSVPLIYKVGGSA